MNANLNALKMSRRTVLRTVLSWSGTGISNLFAQSTRQLSPDVSDSFSAPARALLLQAISDARFRGQIGASVVANLLRTEGFRLDDLMLRLLPLARSFARPPLSNFRVGAVVQGGSGAHPKIG